MANTVTGRSLSEMERSWYSIALSRDFAIETNTSMSLNDLKRNYMVRYLSESAGVQGTGDLGTDELEKQFLIAVISANGSQNAGTLKYMSDIWIALLNTYGYPVKNNISENKRQWFSRNQTSII